MRIHMDDFLSDIKNQKELFWENTSVLKYNEVEKQIDPSLIQDASDRLLRFAPLIASAFAQTAPQGGIIESPLREIPRMQDAVGCPGKLLLKMDSHLPISGSIKARGGIYEVLRHAEDLALKAGLLRQEEDYSLLLKPDLYGNRQSETDPASE